MDFKEARTSYHRQSIGKILARGFRETEEYYLAPDKKTFYRSIEVKYGLLRPPTQAQEKRKRGQFPKQ